MKMSIVLLARLEASVATVMACLKQRERPGGRKWKIYADSFPSYVYMAVNQIIRQGRRSLQIWEHEELDFPSEIKESNSKADRKLKVLSQSRRAREVLCVASINHVLLL